MNIPSELARLCGCGCGTQLVTDSKGRTPTWVRGHFHRGKKHSDEWKRKQGLGVRASWQNPNQQIANRHPSPERGAKISAKLKGRKLSAERVEQIRRQSTGKTHTEQTRAKLAAIGRARPATDKMLEALARGRNSQLFRQTPEQLRANQVKSQAAINWDVLRPLAAQRLRDKIAEWKRTGQLDEIRKRAGNLRGLPDHLAAKTWVIRSPYGDTYHFSNLAEWARKHEHLFVDDRPESKSVFASRIACGLSEMLSKGKTCSYRGWVAVSNGELLRGAPDLLERQPT